MKSGCAKYQLWVPTCDKYEVRKSHVQNDPNKGQGFLLKYDLSGILTSLEFSFFGCLDWMIMMEVYKLGAMGEPTSWFSTL